MEHCSTLSCDLSCNTYINDKDKAMEWLSFGLQVAPNSGGIANMLESRLAIQRELRQAGGMKQHESYKNKQG